MIHLEGRKGAFARAIHAAQLFLKQGVNVTIASMITSFNVEYIDNFIQKMSWLGVHNLRFAPLQRVGRGKSQQILEKYGLSNAVLKHVYFKLAELRENYKTMNIETRDEMYGLQHQPFAWIYKDNNRYTHCGVGRRLISVNPNGDIVPCDFADQPELKLGNILTDDFLSVWDNNSFLNKFRKMIDEGFSECEVCDKYSLCGGGLICNSYCKTGSFNHPDPLCPYRPVMATTNDNRRT